MLIVRSAEKDSVSKFQRVAKSAVESLWWTRALLKSTVGIACRAFTARVCRTALTVLTVES